VKLGDALNGYKAEDKVGTFAEAAACCEIRLARITQTASSRANMAALSEPRLTKWLRGRADARARR
jgi:hypothetical protein